MKYKYLIKAIKQGNSNLTIIGHAANWQWAIKFAEESIQTNRIQELT